MSRFHKKGVKPGVLAFFLAPIMGLFDRCLVLQTRSRIFVTYTLSKNIFKKHKYYSRQFNYALHNYTLNKIQENYFHEDIAPEEDDILIETGGFMGFSTAVFAERCKEVYSIEPSRRNYEMMEKNLSNINNAYIHNIAAWETNGTLTFNYGEEPSDDSLLRTDTNEVETIDVKAQTIKKFAEENEIGSIDYLKIEAEGAEPEVLNGIGELQIDKIAVLCTEERDGESPREEVERILKNKGYNIVGFKKKTLYATNKDYQ